MPTVFTATSLFAGAADLIALIYLFALYRFFFSLSGLDSGSPFAGIGASRELTCELCAKYLYIMGLSPAKRVLVLVRIFPCRELTLGVLVEPILVLSLIVVALIVGSTNVGTISATLAQGWVSPTAH